MKLFTVLAVFLMTIACGSEQSSELNTAFDYSKLIKHKLEADEELVITFVGAIRGSLVDKGVSSTFSSAPETYMHVTTGFVDEIKFGSTPVLHMPLDFPKGKQHKSGEQIILSAKEVNNLIVNRKTIYVEFFEDGFGIDDSSDKKASSDFFLDSDSGFFAEAMKLYQDQTKEDKSYHESVKASKTNSIFEYSLEVRKVQQVASGVFSAEQGYTYSSLGVNVK